MSNEYKDWERDYIAEQNQIVEKYPFLRARGIDGEIDYEDKFPMMGLEIPNGWFKLFYQMCDDIKPIIEDQGLMANFYFLQVKEKYNQLRCYASIDVPEIDAILDKYEQMASQVCVQCGAPASKITSGYIASVCDDCWENNFKYDKTVKELEPTTSYTRIRFGINVDTKEEISFEDEWNRYLDSYMRGKI